MSRKVCFFFLATLLFAGCGDLGRLFKPGEAPSRVTPPVQRSFSGEISVPALDGKGAAAVDAAFPGIAYASGPLDRFYSEDYIEVSRDYELEEALETQTSRRRIFLLKPIRVYKPLAVRGLVEIFGESLSFENDGWLFSATIGAKNPACNYTQLGRSANLGRAMNSVRFLNRTVDPRINTTYALHVAFIGEITGRLDLGEQGAGSVSYVDGSQWRDQNLDVRIGKCQGWLIVNHVVMQRQTASTGVIALNSNLAGLGIRVCADASSVAATVDRFAPGAAVETYRSYAQESQNWCAQMGAEIIVSRGYRSCTQ